MPVAENVSRVRERIAAAARHSGGRPEEIALVAVTKTVPAERIREAYDAGIRQFGENRVQKFAGKATALQAVSGAEWRMIGHLQSNKAARAVELFDSIDTVDSLNLASKLNAAALGLGKRVPVLIEINIGGEPAKSGLEDDSAELQNLLSAAPEFPSLNFRGLMTVPPYSADPQQSRPHFRNLRRLFDEIAGRNLPGIEMQVLSMGMSHDFEVAIEEGSTCVRVGTAIFGPRQA